MKILILILLFLNGLTFAQDSMKLASVEVQCEETPACEIRRTRLKNLIGDYRSLVHLKDTMKLMSSEGGYRSFTYELYEDNGVWALRIKLLIKPVIKEISIGTVDRNTDNNLSQLFALKEGEFFEPMRLADTLEALRVRLDGLGYPKNSAVVDVVEKKDLVYLKVAVTLGAPRIFKKIRTNTKSSFINEYLIRKFYPMYNRPFDFSRFKLYLDDAQKELFTYGYYLLSLDFAPIYKNNRVTLDIKAVHDDLYTFDFRNMKVESRDQLLLEMTNLFRQYKRPLTKTIIKQALAGHYEKKAHLNVDFSITLSTFVNKFKETVHLFRIEVIEGTKTRIKNISFSGNTHYPQEKLYKYYKKQAFELASLGYYDEEFLTYFQGYLKNRYLKNGYVQAKVTGPIKSWDKERQVMNVEYKIEEGKRAYVRAVSFEGLPEEFESILAQGLRNKVGKPFNPIAMVDDIKRVGTLLQESGYYFAEVTNANEDSLVQYSKSGGEVDIRFIVNPGQLVRLNRIIFLGNDKTRNRVLERKIFLEPGELVTPTKTRDIEATLSATGLFNSVNVTPFRHTSSRTATDLIVRLSEREYGLMEIAPGFRTDLGLKLSGSISYQNIAGRNQSITLTSQVNQRVNYQSFDARRRAEKKRILEHNSTIQYNISDILDTRVDMSLGASYQKRRFYSFDAVIRRVNTTFTRDITKKLSTSIRYQYETISQSDATSAIDNGSFQIGAVTPSITYDLRNSQINPQKGAFFNLSCEFANPYFLSQKTSDLTINYYKLVSRNRFYLPFKNGTVALSLVGGMQENLANASETTADGEKITEGYIPNIKVFRLTGMDIVRGFNDFEINRLPDGRDIAKVRVDDKAYLAIAKVEPRFFLTDNFIGGVFYDAGRVFVNELKLGELRDSVGITFKILTPVGTLDFDYGIKLLRKKDVDGRLEDPGRFHVSIGFF